MAAAPYTTEARWPRSADERSRVVHSRCSGPGDAQRVCTTLACEIALALWALTDELRVLARLVDYLGPGAGTAPADVDAAALTAILPARRAWVVAAATAALQRAAGGGASVSSDVLAQIGYLQTAAVLLGAIERVVAAAHPPAAARLQPVPAFA